MCALLGRLDTTVGLALIQGPPQWTSWATQKVVQDKERAKHTPYESEQCQSTEQALIQVPHIASRTRVMH